MSTLENTTSNNLAARVKEMFMNDFGPYDLCVAAPGRINILGEHTDYNDGFVLPAAVDRCVYMAIAQSGTSVCRIHAMDLDEEFDIDLNEQLKPSTEVGWANYFLGVVAEMQNQGLKIQGFNLVFASNVPIGAGMSSSAAIECGFGLTLQQLFGLALSKEQIALIGQKAEHTYAGVKCGIMDQFASSLGAKDHVIKLDCRSLTYQLIPAKFGDYSLVLFDTKVKHNLAGSAYNTRREQCETGVEAVRAIDPSVKSLRDISIDHLDQVKSVIDEKVYQRCEYVIKEIQRTELACEAMSTGNVDQLGKLMYSTHEGLSRQYEVSCKELDLLVDLVKGMETVAGARMMGGGFGGCTLNLIATKHLQQVKTEVTKAYLAAVGHEPDVYEVNISDGIRTIA
ncbi:MAG: galactokinase [Cyclobacteriaceae bacterium]